MMHLTAEPVFDPHYIIQGLWSDGTLCGSFDEHGYDDEERAVEEAKGLLKASWFEGDSVRVISRDGELVWESGHDDG